MLKDGVVLNAALTFTWGLGNYIRLLLVIFCGHALMPLEVDQVEAVTLYQAWGAWFTHSLGLPFTLLVGSLGLGLILNQVLGSGRASLLRLLVAGVVLGHFLAGGFLL